MIPALVLLVATLAQEEYRQVATFHKDRTPDDRLFRLLTPEGVVPPEMKDRVLFVRNQTLECWTLSKPERAWTAELPCARPDFPRALGSRFRGGLLHAWDMGRVLVDLRTGRPAEMPFAGAMPDPLGDGRLLFTSSDDAGMRFRVGAWEWSVPRKLARGWHAHDSRRIAALEISGDSSTSRMLIREIGTDRPALELQLPFPGYPEAAIVDDRVYVTMAHPGLSFDPDAKPPDPPLPFAWVLLTIDAAAGQILDKEVFPYSENARRQRLNVGRHNPVRVKTASGIAGRGKLIVEPHRVSLFHKQPVWEKAFHLPQIVHRDEEMLGVRTEDRVTWLRTTTGSVVFEHPLEESFSQYYDRIGPFVYIMGLTVKDPSPGVYSIVTGDRLAANPRKKDLEPGTYGIDFSGLVGELSADGDRGAVNLGRVGGAPGEIAIFDLRTGKRRATVKVGEPVTEIALRGQVLVTMSASGVRVYAP